MQATIRRSKDRGAASFGWLDSKHSFSFGEYHDAGRKRLDRALNNLIDECQPHRWPECPIMDALSKTA